MATSASLAKTDKYGDLRRRLVFLLLALVVYRVGAHIPVPGIDPTQLQQLFQGQQGGILNLFNMFSGGALSRFTVFALGIMPYISASIIMQLLTYVLPSLEQLKKEGEAGRRKITQYTRYGTLGLALFQSMGIALALESSAGLVLAPGMGFRITAMVSLTAGTMFLMWIGEQVTEKGIGNGISLIITVGIVARLPAALVAGWQVFVPPAGSGREPISPFVLFLLLAFLFAVIASTIALTQALRKVSVQYAKQVRGNRVYGGQTSFLPLKVNYAGVMPIIFANAILLFPASIIGFLFPGSPTANRIAAALATGWLHYVLYAGMIFFFSYFWVAMVFNPIQIADDMKRHGGFIPGVRPGETTAQFLDFAMTRLTFAGAIFLTVLAVLPMLVQNFMGIPSITAQFFGGTGLLIIVGVMLDTMRQAETYLLQRHYDGFLRKGRIKGRTVAATVGSSNAISERQIAWLLVIIAIIALAGVVISLR